MAMLRCLVSTAGHCPSVQTRHIQFLHSMQKLYVQDLSPELRLLDSFQCKIPY
jgi:hypothetical protein